MRTLMKLLRTNEKKYQSCPFESPNDHYAAQKPTPPLQRCSSLDSANCSYKNAANRAPANPRPSTGCNILAPPADVVVAGLELPAVPAAADDAPPLLVRVVTVPLGVGWVLTVVLPLVLPATGRPEPEITTVASVPVTNASVTVPTKVGAPAGTVMTEG